MMQKGKNKTKKFPWNIALVLVAAALAAIFTVSHFALATPCGSVGACPGALGVDSGYNLSLGSSTVDSTARVLIIASTTAGTGTYPLRVISPGSGTGGAGLFIIRDDGKVTIGNSTFLASGTLQVTGQIMTTGTTAGIIFGDGTQQTTAAGPGNSLNASYVAAGTFGSNVGNGNYAFPGQLTLPSQTTSYQGQLLIGTAGPSASTSSSPNSDDQTIGLEVGRSHVSITTTTQFIRLESNGTGSNGGYISWWAGTPTPGHEFARIGAYDGEGDQIATGDGALTFGAGNRAAESMRIASSGVVLVGTSTITNAAKLSVVGADLTAGHYAFEAMGSNSTLGLFVQNNGDVAIGAQGALSQLDVSGNVAIGTYASTTAAPANGLIVSGNIGIATATPDQALDVFGNIDISSGSAYMYNNVNIIRAQTALHNYLFGNSGNLTMSGTDNTALGFSALNVNTTGAHNAAIGYGALVSNTTGQNNTAIGYSTLFNNTTGQNNIAIGDFVLQTNTTGNNNIAIGYSALANATSGTANNNTALGYNAGNSVTTGSGNVFLGYNAGSQETGSNKLYIANTNTATPLIYGDFNTNVLKVAGHLNFATSTPTISSCGTSPTVAGSDNAGRVTVGSSATSSCVINFATAFVNSPVCQFTVEGQSPNTVKVFPWSYTTARVVASSTVTLTSGWIIDWTCFGYGL